eukprot:NODE_500_length_6721_cov_0.845492.p3 type:complete len:273 gc:universal NODE_500_length_6721_cov_0.845492:5701-6519(+)
MIYYNQQRVTQYQQLISKKFEEPIKDYKDRYQIELDVKRSFGQLRKKPLSELQQILDYVFYHSQKNYVQGFHDVCATLLMISENAKYIAYTLAINQFSEFLKEDGVMKAEQMCQESFNLIRIHDKPLYAQIKEIPPSFFISWILTAFQHDITNLESKLLILDLVALESIDYLVYFTSAVIIDSRHKIISFGGEQEILKELSALRHLGEVNFKHCLKLCEISKNLKSKYPYEKLRKYNEKDLKKLEKSQLPYYILGILILIVSILMMSFNFLE